MGDGLAVADALAAGVRVGVAEGVGVGVSVGDGVGVGVGVGDGVGVGVGLINFRGDNTQIIVAVCPARDSVIFPAGVNFRVAGS